VKAEYGFNEESNPPFILEEGITAAPGSHAFSTQISRPTYIIVSFLKLYCKFA
jgi:hypothetical protein